MLPVESCVFSTINFTVFFLLDMPSKSHLIHDIKYRHFKRSVRNILQEVLKVHLEDLRRNTNYRICIAKKNFTKGRIYKFSCATVPYAGRAVDKSFASMQS